MTDLVEGIPVEGAPEAVPAEPAASEATQNTSGLPENEATAEAEPDQKAKAEAEEKERKSRNERKREARDKVLRELAERDAAAREAAQRLEEVRKAAQSLPAPKLEDFKTFEEYQARLTAHAVATAMDERTLKGMEAQARQTYAEAQAARTAAEAAAKEHVATSIEEARARYPDFEKVALVDAPIDAQLMSFISRTDAPADVAYWLGKNPAEGERIRQLAHTSPVDAARAIGRIEAFVSAPKAPPVTAAPEPVSPVRAKATPIKSPESMSYEEWKAARRSGTIR